VQFLIEEVRFAADSPVEGDGFELSVPGARGYRFGAFVCRLMSLLFGARLLQAGQLRAPALLAQRRQKLKCRARREDADKIRPAHSRPRAQGSPIGAGVSHIRQKAEAAGTCLFAVVEQERSRQREVRNGRAAEAAERSKALSDSS
jgi:hypothetical protein